ncbi:ferredoxin-type protein NapF [Seohaeicola saemankumensis]|nr:ferredoxin-type protein NapF [Seohaeicola saemankumensis]MCA0870502.1 ferredoxin-type protein NapF [Seohaeicola saemankumensis]
MTSQTSRRAFLRGAFMDRGALRPFGAVADSLFADACTKCGDCASACPEAIIVMDKDGFPVIDPKVGACTQCGVCIDVCDTGALDAGQPWLWKASAKSSCLSRNGVHCRTCQDFCDAGAIRFQLQTGGRSEPRIDLDQCIGCGGCVSSCPINAVELVKMKPQMEAQTC